MYPEAKFGLKITATEIAEGCWQILCCQQLFCHPAATLLNSYRGNLRKIIQRSASEAARNKTLASSAERYEFVVCLYPSVSRPLISRENGELY